MKCTDSAINKLFSESVLTAGKSGRVELYVDFLSLFNYREVKMIYINLLFILFHSI